MINLSRLDGSTLTVDKVHYFGRRGTETWVVHGEPPRQEHVLETVEEIRRLTGGYKLLGKFRGPRLFFKVSPRWKFWKPTWVEIPRPFYLKCTTALRVTDILEIEDED